MRLSAPKEITFVVAVVVALIGILGEVLKVGGLQNWAIWIVVLGFVILAIGNLADGI